MADERRRRWFESIRRAGKTDAVTQAAADRLLPDHSVYYTDPPRSGKTLWLLHWLSQLTDAERENTRVLTPDGLLTVEKYEAQFTEKK